MRGDISLQVRTVGARWPRCYRLTYHLGPEFGTGRDSRIVGWGNTTGEAVAAVCRDPRAMFLHDLSGYLFRLLELKSEPPALVGSGGPTNEKLGYVADLHNVFKIVHWWPRENELKFRAEALAPDPEQVERYRADLDVYFSGNVARIVMPREPKSKVIEFCVPASLISPDAQCFYRFGDELYFYRTNDASTCVQDFEWTVPVDAVIFLLPNLEIR